MWVTYAFPQCYRIETFYCRDSHYYQFIHFTVLVTTHLDLHAKIKDTLFKGSNWRRKNFWVFLKFWWEVRCSQGIPNTSLPLYRRQAHKEQFSDRNFNPDLGQNNVFFTTNSKMHNSSTKANIQGEKWEQQPHCKFTNNDNCYQFSTELHTILGSCIPNHFNLKMLQFSWQIH